MLVCVVSFVGSKKEREEREDGSELDGWRAGRVDLVEVKAGAAHPIGVGVRWLKREGEGSRTSRALSGKDDKEGAARVVGIRWMD